MPLKVRASYSIRQVTDKSIFIVDNDDGVSVTNDAEAVCAELFQRSPHRRIVYKDTEGIWSELVHENGVFKKFSDYSGKVPTIFFSK